MDTPAILEHIRDTVDGESTDNRAEIDGTTRLHARELGTREFELSPAEIVVGLIPFGVIRVEGRRPAGFPVAKECAGRDVEGACRFFLQGLGEIPERLEMVARGHEGTIGHAVNPSERAAVVAGVDLEV